MAVQQQQMLPPQYVEDLQTDFGKQLTALTATPLDTSRFAPTVAGQDQLQTQAATLAGQGVGAFQPYLTQAAAYTGPTGYQQFMSPYQQDVIDATLSEFDKQRAMDLNQIGMMAAGSGNLGGGREGVLRSEYQTQSNLDRAALQARMLQQGFQEAQRGAQTAFGQAQQLGADQQRLAQLVPQLRGRDIATLGQAGAIQQAQKQAELDQQREANRLAAYEPYERLGFMGTGLGSLFGSAMGQYQSSVVPNQSPLQQALGLAATGIGAYKAFNT